MIYIACSRKSDGARQLAQALFKDGARRIRQAKEIKEPGLVVNWGESIAPGLNQNAGRSKRTEMEKFLKADVPTLKVSFTRPEDVDGWLARAASHQEGRDLLKPGGFTPALWTRWENLKWEFRVHVFRRGPGLDGLVSVRLGSKFPRPDVKSPHAWIRSYAGGWRILYDAEAQVRAAKIKGLRKAAAKAIDALGLDFGAVDLGVRERDGGIMVLEVNSAPGLEGHTLEVYAREIKRIAGE